MGSISDTGTAVPMPVAGKSFFSLAPGMALIQPLSRRGKGPGMLVLTNNHDASGTITIRNGFPSPALKWAEEGYTVVEIRGDALGGALTKDTIQLALESLDKCDACEPKNVVGLVAYDPSLFNKLLPSLNGQSSIKGYVVYDDMPSATDSTKTQHISSPTPLVRHYAGSLPVSSTKPQQRLPRSAQYTAYEYSSSKSYEFATPFNHEHFHSSNEAVSHTRNLTFLKKVMDGPYFDLEEIWDEHTYFEFGERSVEKTMATMVQEPYVNHVPTMTGGIGRDRLTNFYRHNFIFSNPPGTELELISRTVGIDRVVDEFIFKFDHTTVIDWMLPGIPPTGKRVEVPFTAVVNVRGDRLYHEHIAWDQANVLRQLGLMPEYLPFPYPVTEKSEGSNGTATSLESSKNQNLEYRVPVAGIEASNKMRDKNSEESNLMFEYSVREKK